MFEAARLKLTAWYLLIIMLISISFSVAIYQVLTSELNRVERIQRIRQQRELSLNDTDNIPADFSQRIFRQPIIDPELLEETKNRLILILFMINAGILGISALSGYFLAGRTLKPIKNMVDEQNRFITDSSHELRTPLTSLKSEIEVNLRDKNLNLNQAKKLLESNLEEVNNLQYLSDNLIKLAQYEKANGIILLEEIALKQIVSDAIKKVANLAKNKNIQIKEKTHEYTLFANSQSLTELFVILLDNAIKYSLKNSKITLNSKKTDNNVFIEVIDQGMGVEAKDLPHLFDRFYRSDKSRTKSNEIGFGLGLSIAKQIVEKHHGSIKVESEAKKGSVFIVQLPVK